VEQCDVLLAPWLVSGFKQNGLVRVTWYESQLPRHRDDATQEEERLSIFWFFFLGIFFFLSWHIHLIVGII